MLGFSSVLKWSLKVPSKILEIAPDIPPKKKNIAVAVPTISEGNKS